MATSGIGSIWTKSITWLMDFFAVGYRPSTRRMMEDYERNAHQIDYLFAWYEGTLLMEGSPFREAVIKQYQLYHLTRLTWNPASDVVDFWAGITYPGNITSGKDSAIPLEGPENEKIDDNLKATAYQVLDWGAWNIMKALAERYNAIVGNLLIVVHDDVESGNVYPKIVPPWHVKDVVTNHAGRVQSYIEEYKIDLDSHPATRVLPEEERRKKEGLFRLEVDKQFYRTYLDGKLFDFSLEDENGQRMGAVWPNPYGFVPAVYRYFQRTMGMRGMHALGSSLGELAAINSIESHLDDQVHKSVDPTVIFWADGGGLKKLLTKDKKIKPGIGLDEPTQRPDSFRFLQGPSGGSVSTVSGSDKVEAGLAHLQHKKEEWKARFPEYTIFQQLRTMDLSGVAIDLLLGDIKPDVVERRAEADPRTVEIIQMCISIAGQRYQEGEGGWQKRTDAQEKFSGYDLTSYDQGLLNLRIGERPFVPEPPLTEKERWELVALIREALDLDLEYLIETIVGADQDEIKKMKLAEAVARQEEQRDAGRLIAGLAARDDIPALPPGEVREGGGGNPGNTGNAGNNEGVAAG